MIQNSNIVLTGCNSGIGLEVLKLLVQGNNKILCVDINSDKLKQFEGENVFILEQDVSSPEGVDKIFDVAIEKLGSIDIFYANAGYPYYEEMNYVDWNRVQRMFETNVFSPIYSYQKYVKYLNGREGKFAITVSAIGQMAMPGFTIYSASKFAMHGFQEAIRFEKPSNLQLTCLYPVATNTNFFKAATDRPDCPRPFPVQEPSVVAKKMVKGIEKGKKRVSPCALFGLSRVLMTICPPVKAIYLKMETNKFKKFINK